MTQPPTTSPLTRTAQAIIAALIVVAVVARVVPSPRTIDDAFITFRYSRNIVQGEGFVYNPGVRTLGTTTPLFTLAMAGAGAVFGTEGFPWYALVANALADAATVTLLYLTLRRVTGNDYVGAIPGLLWALSPMSVTFAIGGMETSVNILWLVAATWAYVTRRDVLVGVFVALGVLTRIDAGLWIAPLILFQLGERFVTRRGETFVARFPLKTWIAAAVVALPWFAFSTLYFGSPLPNSLSAKTVAYQLPEGAAWVTLIQAYSNLFFEFNTFGAAGVMVAAVVYVTLNLFALLYATRRAVRLLPFLLYPWFYMLAFSVANPLIFRWYMAPPLPALMVGVVLGLWALTEKVRESERLRPVAGVAFAALTVLWAFTSLNAWTMTPDHGPQRPAPRMAWHQIELYYQDIGTQLREEYGVTADTRVASADIGAVGYFSGATIIDTVGLVTPELSAYYPNPPELLIDGQNYAVPPQLILDTEPSYFVTMEAFVRRGLEQDPDFNAQYTLLRVIPTDFYGTGMRLYGRTDAPLESE